MLLIFHRAPMKQDPLLPRWIRWWLIVSAIICSIDVSFTMLRPMTLRDGPLYSLYYLCSIVTFVYFISCLWCISGNIYADIDVRYGSTNDLVTHVTGPLMILEIVLNVIALIMVGPKLILIYFLKCAERILKNYLVWVLFSST